MAQFLEFKNAKCKDCYKCLRECPVKAIDVKNHQAMIIEDRCILCGHCTNVCPQNAKSVCSELSVVRKMLMTDKVYASVAPSFISSFGLQDFTVMKIALGKIGFYDAEETAVGAEAVTAEYKKLLESGGFKNFITSACPAVCRMIQEYYPMALKYLAPVDSPMIAHAKIIKQRNPDVKVVFIGPCIAKKREAFESGLVSAVLTFEDMQELFKEKGISLADITSLDLADKEGKVNLSKAYPISHGIIKSFDDLPKGYEYMAVDGPKRCADALKNIDKLSNVFVEMNLCKDACVSGPCSLVTEGGSIKSTSDVLNYVRKDMLKPSSERPKDYGIDFSAVYPRIRSHSLPVPEHELRTILAKTGKMKTSDELNCGACGYPTCRDKAWAVYNGYADVEICLPYMRERAESLSFEIIQNSPEGLLVLDADLNIVEVNNKARELLGINDPNAKGKPANTFFNPVDFLIAYNSNGHVEVDKMFVPTTKKYVSMSINHLKAHDVLFGIIKDITETVGYEEQFAKVKMQTIETAEEVIKKQMRVAQEIASLLGETTAETKVALLNLKKTLTDDNNKGGL